MLFRMRCGNALIRCIGLVVGALDLAAHVRLLARDIVFCFCDRHLTEHCGRTETPTAGNEPKREISSKRVQQILKSTNKLKSTLKLIICRCCFYLKHIFEVARFEVIFWAFFFAKAPDLNVMGLLEGLKTIHIKIKIGVTEIQANPGNHLPYHWPFFNMLVTFKLSRQLKRLI